MDTKDGMYVMIPLSLFSSEKRRNSPGTFESRQLDRDVGERKDSCAGKSAAKKPVPTWNKTNRTNTPSENTLMSALIFAIHALSI